MDGCFYDGPTVPKAPLRVEVLLAEMQTVLDQIRPDPLAAWMSRQGFDPRLGGRLLLPTDLKPELGPFPPHYVLFVEHTAQPVLILAGIYNSIPSTYTVEQP